MADYYAGTSGLVLPVANKSMYPPEYREKSRLSYYAALFNSLEVNSSFYKIPQAKTVAKWATEVPDDFRFTYKLWRGITHEKGMVFNPDDVLRFMQVINEAGEKKGCLLVQFPPGAQAHLMPQLQKLIANIQGADPDSIWKIAVEFRHPSWYNKNTARFAEMNHLCIVTQDIPASATPLDFIDSDVIYLRFHGPGGQYRGSYTDDFLQEYSTYIHEWQAEGKTVYVYFNNTMGDAVHNLATLNGYVSSIRSL